MQRQQVMQAAEKLVRRGRLQAAIGEYRKILQESPNDTGTLNRVGDLYARLDRVEEAVELFLRAARHFADEGFFVKAIALYKKIIRIDPTQIEVYERLAELYHRQGLVNEARTQYQVVADYFNKAGDADAAVSVYKRMVELEPENPSHRVKLADLYTRGDMLAQAVDQYRAISRLMLQHGKVEQALKVYLSGLELKSDDLGFITDAVLDLRRRGHEEAADRFLEAAIERNPEAARVQAISDAEPAAAQALELPVEELEGGEDLAEIGAEAEEELLVLDLEEIEEPLPFAGPVEAEADVEAEPEAEVDAGAELEAEVDAGAELEAELEAEVEAEVAAPDEEFDIGLEDLEAEPVAEAAAEEDPAAVLEAIRAEAEVLVRYGLEDKAVERFEEILELDATSLNTYRRLIELHLKAGRPSEVTRLASRAVVVSREQGRRGVWAEIEAGLLGAGYRVEGLTIEAPAEAPPEPPAAAPPPPVEEPVTEALDTEETDLSWLDTIGVEDPAAAAAEEQLFGEEQQFFDLAAELEQELREEDLGPGEELVPRLEEQSLEEIVEGFKKGMAETLSAEDYDTHYNLGIAYREMGLVDEAIGEFQLAAKDSRYLVDCCSLLGHCFLEKGFPDLAIKWYQRGLDSPDIEENESLGLLYELGNLYMTLGDPEAAQRSFAEIYGINSNFRDVVAKLEELRAR